MTPMRQRGFYSEVLDAELEPTSQADLKQVWPCASRRPSPRLSLISEACRFGQHRTW